MMFTDQSGNLTKDAYDFLFGLFQRVGGSLDNLNAATLETFTWEAPGTIGSTTPASGKFTSVQATNGFGCNGKAPQTAVASGGTLAGTATNTDIINKVNLIINALVANGVLS